MWAVVGLGNPGRDYSRTRHNSGFEFVKRLSKRWDIRIRKRSHLSKIARVDRPGGKVLLVLPQTYMNDSGRAVKSLAEQGGIRTDRMVVAYDDFDLPLGEIRIRKEGGAGSHKGMASIIQELGTRSLARIRIGIGPLPEDADPVTYVLAPFNDDEWQRLEEPLDRAAAALEMILDGGIDTAMSLHNAVRPAPTHPPKTE